jgi:hypothetical protein
VGTESGTAAALVDPAHLPAPDSVGRSAAFAVVWPETLEWVQPYYDGVHLFHTGRWLLTLDPDASDPLLIAAVTHDMERHFPGGTQPDKAAGKWDDEAYNREHCRRSAEIVGAWLRRQGAPEDFVRAVERPILEHEFGGSPQGNLLQAADSLSFLEVNWRLASAWVTRGETSLELALTKLDWMYERIKLERARKLALPYYDRALQATREDVARARRGA